MKDKSVTVIIIMLINNESILLALEMIVLVLLREIEREWTGFKSERERVRYSRKNGSWIVWWV